MKSNNKKSKTKVPFYAHLLTAQEMKQTAGGDPTNPRQDLIMTSPTDDIQSMKWPSDQEDGGGGLQ